MKEDGSQNKEALEIISPKEAKARLLAKAEDKKKKEAERLFSEYCISWQVWRSDPALKQAALDMLGTGFFGDNELKGHAGHKETYPVPLGDIIAELVARHDDYTHIVFHPMDIINAFDDSFRIVAAMASLGGVTDYQIQKVKKEWRDKLSVRVAQGGISPHWRRLLKDKTLPAWRMSAQTEAQAFAVIFLNFVPQAPDNRVEIWVNAMLISLRQRPVASSTLREYIAEYKRLNPHLQQSIKK